VLADQQRCEAARREAYACKRRQLVQQLAEVSEPGLDAVEVMDDGDLLRVAFVLEAKETLDGLVGLLPRARLDGVIEAAAREALSVEVVDLLST
jgi:hypothetical protein